jgi:hypothetical protein
MQRPGRGPNGCEFFLHTLALPHTPCHALRKIGNALRKSIEMMPKKACTSLSKQVNRVVIRTDFQTIQVSLLVCSRPRVYVTDK